VLLSAPVGRGRFFTARSAARDEPRWTLRRKGPESALVAVRARHEDHGHQRRNPVSAPASTTSPAASYPGTSGYPMPGKRRHLAGPEKLLRAGGNARMRGSRRRYRRGPGSLDRRARPGRATFGVHRGSRQVAVHLSWSYPSSRDAFESRLSRVALSLCVSVYPDRLLCQFVRTHILSTFPDDFRAATRPVTKGRLERVQTVLAIGEAGLEQ
jgi:hypothetical protein